MEVKLRSSGNKVHPSENISDFHTAVTKKRLETPAMAWISIPRATFYPMPGVDVIRRKINKIQAICGSVPYLPSLVQSYDRLKKQRRLEILKLNRKRTSLPLKRLLYVAYVLFIADSRRYYASSASPSAKLLVYGVLYGWYKKLLPAIRKPHVNYIEIVVLLEEVCYQG